MEKLLWKRACSECCQIIVQGPRGNDSCSLFIMQILRCLQKCGKLKMMAVVRTSLQKVVVLLHRLQRMAVSSPRYQKLCKVSKNWKVRLCCCVCLKLIYWMGILTDTVIDTFFMWSAIGSVFQIDVETDCYPLSHTCHIWKDVVRIST